MAYYDDRGFTQMQIDALERMREMQKRSKTLVCEEPPAKCEDSPPPEKVHTHQQPSVKPRPTHMQQSSSISSFLGGFSGIDPEKLLIIIMLYILYKNKADIKLLIALGYLLI